MISMPSSAFLHSLESVVCDIREHEQLGLHNTIQIGGPARYMAFPANESELAGLMRLISNEPDLEKALIGRGANMFADSRGYDGLIINMTRWDSEFILDDAGLLVVSGGVDMHAAAVEAARRGWCGIDFMGVVPGTIGAAVAINAGTNVEGYVADCLKWVDAVNYAGEKRHYCCEEMEFGYRTSRLLYGREIIARAAFQLIRCEQAGRTPESTLAFFEKAMDARRAKFPLDLPNFGSTFRSPGPPHPPAGKFIDDLGMKGLRIGNAQISAMHGNFIVNLGGASSEDVLALMQRMHDAVFERYQVSLRPEVHYLCNSRRPKPSFFLK